MVSAPFAFHGTGSASVHIPVTFHLRFPVFGKMRAMTRRTSPTPPIYVSEDRKSVIFSSLCPKKEKNFREPSQERMGGNFLVDGIPKIFFFFF